MAGGWLKIKQTLQDVHDTQTHDGVPGGRLGQVHVCASDVAPFSWGQLPGLT